MSDPIRLLTTPGDRPNVVLFSAIFAAPDPTQVSTCAPASLDTGDGHVLDVGVLCAPTATTWREQRQVELATHTYADEGPYTAQLTWGELVVPATEPAAEAVPPAVPAVTSTVAPLPDSPLQVEVTLHVTELAADHQVRLDSGTGQIYALAGRDGAEQTGSWTLDFPKPGEYVVAADLLDGDSFWVASLVAEAVEIVDPIAEPLISVEEAAEAPEAVPFDAPEAVAAEPWLPFRYARPVWSWSKTYAAPGSTRVVRSLAPGTYLGIHAEAMAGGALWYQTASRDWIPAAAVSIMQPSSLRGVELAGGTPPPPPPPPPPPGRRGVVTATVLNVRARPGVFAGNPPVGSLPMGMEVTIYEQQLVGSEVWYRIGTNRWVHSNWVRLLPAAGPVVASAEGFAAPASGSRLPVGWVYASVLNVRSGPSTTFPVVGSATHNQSFDVLQITGSGSSTWYRIGADQWLHAGGVRLASLSSRPGSIGRSERWVAVRLAQQTVVAYEGDTPVFAGMAATGLPGTPTVRGIFRTWLRRPTGKMSGGRPGAGYYYLEDVTWTEFFYSGYALHTAYWMDAFGSPRSHGCVNLSPYDAWWIYQWSAASGSRSPVVHVF
jgi:uncharacterized protein YraI